LDDAHDIDKRRRVCVSPQKLKTHDLNDSKPGKIELPASLSKPVQKFRRQSHKVNHLCCGPWDTFFDKNAMFTLDVRLAWVCISQNAFSFCLYLKFHHPHCTSSGWELTR